VGLGDWFGRWWVMVWVGKNCAVNIGMGQEMENHVNVYLQVKTKRLGPLYIQFWRPTIKALN
jgi:hypothetical protein